MSKEIEDLTYEEAFQELTGVVSALETNENTLEESLALFSRGQALARRCQILLDEAELKVRQLVNGQLIDFESPTE